MPKKQMPSRFYLLVQRHRILTILMAAVLTVGVLLLLSMFPKEQKRITVTEQNGVYDLREVKEFGKSVIRMVPNDYYYPNTYISPDNIPDATGTDEYKNISADYLSQRFVILVPNSNDIYKMTFSLSGRHAMRVYVNGTMAAQTGELGTTKNETVVWENNITFDASAVDGKMDIILNSAQFYHAGKGATLSELTIGKAQSSSSKIDIEKIKGMAVVGALLCASALLFGIYILLSHTKVTLYFAIACFVMGIREFLRSQVWTYFPIQGNISFMLEYLTFALLTIFLSLYLGQYANNKYLRWTEYTAISVSVIYSLFTLFCDSIFYTGILVYYQIAVVICIAIGVSGMFWNMRRPTKEQAAALYGIAVFYMASLTDIFMYNDVFGNVANIPVSETSMLVFVLAQTFSLFLMNNRVLAESKESEQKMSAEKEALEGINRLKTEFLSNVSHELKTPLTVVSGYAQLLRSQLAGPENADSRDKARIISSEADRLALMVGQVLDVTRIEEGRIQLDKRPCHIDELIYNAVETHFPILNKSGNKLVIDVSLELPEVIADSGRITQVLVNLIANALKHTEKGTITVSAVQIGSFIAVSVSDTGTGMSQDEQERLFTRFSRPKQGSYNTGTGLGLYICKYLVEEHGGKIQVESTENKGTTVTFMLRAISNSDITLI